VSKYKPHNQHNPNSTNTLILDTPSAGAGVNNSHSRGLLHYLNAVNRSQSNNVWNGRSKEPQRIALERVDANDSCEVMPDAEEDQRRSSEIDKLKMLGNKNSPYSMKTNSIRQSYFMNANSSTRLILPNSKEAQEYYSPNDATTDGSSIEVENKLLMKKLIAYKTRKVLDDTSTQYYSSINKLTTKYTADIESLLSRLSKLDQEIDQYSSANAHLIHMNHQNETKVNRLREKNMYASMARERIPNLTQEINKLRLQYAEAKSQVPVERPETQDEIFNVVVMQIAMCAADPLDDVLLITRAKELEYALRIRPIE